MWKTLFEESLSFIFRACIEGHSDPLCPFFYYMIERFGTKSRYKYLFDKMKELTRKCILRLKVKFYFENMKSMGI